MPIMKRGHDSSALSGRVLKSLIASLIEHAQRDVARLETHEECATHQLRVRMKKILALLRLGADSLQEHTIQAMRLHIRAVKNACASNRDRVVRDRLVDRLARRYHLSPLHRIEHGQSPSQPPPASFLLHQLHALDQLVQTTRLEMLSPEQIIASHALCYRKGRRLMKMAFEGTQGDTLHRWRHRVKDLHYQTLALAHLPGSVRRVRRARKLGRILGREHDLANLLRHSAYAVKRGPWSHLIQEHRSQLRERILILGHKLYNPGPQVFEHKIVRQMQVA